VGQSGWRVDANQALWRAIRPRATQRARCAVHIAGDGQSVRSRKGQREALGATFDQLLAKTVFEGMKAPRDRGVIHAKGAGRRRQASVSPQGQENPQVLPVNLCAFFISHSSKITNSANLEDAHLSAKPDTRRLGMTVPKDLRPQR
jgi:hypothetical protein